MRRFFVQILFFFAASAGIIIGINNAQAQSTDADAFGRNDYAIGVAVTGAPETAGEAKSASLIQVVKNFINWVLGILSLITLVLLLWGGFQMITAAGDETKHKKGWTILKQAAIGLAFIALSWFVVSIIFWVIDRTAGPSAVTTP